MVGRGIWRWAVILSMATLGMAMTLPTLADDWWRVRIPGSDRDLWLEVDRQRVWISGHCDGGRPAERFVDQGDRLVVELVEYERADLPGAVLEIEQQMTLELHDGSGTLRLEGPTAASVLVFQVSAVKRDVMPGCGSDG